MGETEYSEALKLGKKEYRARIAKGQFPYLPVLDEILSEADIQTEQNMGLVHVPLDFVVGTSTMGRTYSFAANFMPILDWETEFAVKWSNLSDAQMNEGIRDPIKAFEYMNTCKNSSLPLRPPRKPVNPPRSTPMPAPISEPIMKPSFIWKHFFSKI